jgi:hypothetical protein
MPETEDRIAELYRSSKAGVTPPPELDARILAEAQRQQKHSRRLPWSALAAAATLVIGVGLTWFHVGVPPTLTPPPEPAPAGEEAPAPPPSMPAWRDAETVSTQRAMREAIPRDAPAEQELPKTRMESVTADTAALEVVVPMADKKPTTPDCAGALEGASAQAWRDAVAAARATGDCERLNCLLAAYRARFGDTVEID